MHNDMLLENKVFTLNESFINSFKGTSSITKTIPSRTNNSTMC